jgi:hypothetical protein
MQKIDFFYQISPKLGSKKKEGINSFTMFYYSIPTHSTSTNPKIAHGDKE